MAQFLCNGDLEERRLFSILAYTVGKQRDSCGKQQRKTVCGRKKGIRKAVLRDWVGKEE